MTVIDIAQFNGIEAQLKKLIKEHRGIKDEPLQLAVHYTPLRPGRNVYLFEIADRFGANTVDPGKKMFEVSYGSTAGFPMDADQELRLLLTNPIEWKIAVEKGWRSVMKLREARANGRGNVLFATARGSKLWDMLRD